MIAGRSTSPLISSLTAAACASWSWSTTARASAWRWSPTPRSPVSGSPANSIGCWSRTASQRTIVSDNGTELTSNAILRWADDHKVEWHYIAPGKPVQNAFAESFIGPLARMSCLTRRCSGRYRTPAPRSMLGAPITITTGRHSRLGWLSPAIYAAQRRSAALRSPTAPHPQTAATTAQQGTTHAQTPIAIG